MFLWASCGAPVFVEADIGSNSPAGVPPFAPMERKKEIRLGYPSLLRHFLASETWHINTSPSSQSDFMPQLRWGRGTPAGYARIGIIVATI
ncbi:MAG TPA: hypothetical protein DEO84_05380 [candidate division Zixibacteria bacterium]|nr:hypothetical protein [candidate division Zixibacteria bacterium]HBZ00737.1 hypothetical protein [candidate division Zixibacteria bacterium]